MTEGRHIVARAVLPRAERGYEGTLKLWGFVYGIEITRHADGVQAAMPYALRSINNLRHDRPELAHAMDVWAERISGLSPDIPAYHRSSIFSFVDTGVDGLSDHRKVGR